MKALRLRDDVNMAEIVIAPKKPVSEVLPDQVEISSARGPEYVDRSYLSLEDAARLHFWLGALLQREVSG